MKDPNSGPALTWGQRAARTAAVLFALLVVGLIAFGCVRGWPALGDFR